WGVGLRITQKPGRASPGWAVWTPAPTCAVRLQPRALGIGRQIGGPRGQLLRIGLDFLQHDFDGLLQLRVLPFHYQVGAILDHNVGLHAAVLHHPLAVEVVARGLGTRNVASIHKRYLAADATHSAPGAFADEGAEFVVLEVIAEYVTVRGSITIGHTGHGAVEYDWGNGVALPVANGAHAGQHAPQPGEDELVHKAAAVVAHVDNHSLFADLRKVLFDEFIQPRASHIREIDVADAPIAGGINLFAIALDPGQFAEAVFIRHRLYLHGVGAILRRFGVDGQ